MKKKRISTRPEPAPVGTRLTPPPAINDQSYHGSPASAHSGNSIPCASTLTNSQTYSYEAPPFVSNYETEPDSGFTYENVNAGDSSESDHPRQ